jgi:hypothetical protein
MTENVRNAIMRHKEELVDCMHALDNHVSQLFSSTSLSVSATAGLSQTPSRRAIAVGSEF